MNIDINTVEHLRSFFVFRSHFTGSWAVLLEGFQVRWPDSAPYAGPSNPVIVGPITSRKADRPACESTYVEAGGTVESVPGEGWRVVFENPEALVRRVTTDALRERYNTYYQPTIQMAGPKGHLP